MNTTYKSRADALTDAVEQLNGLLDTCESGSVTERREARSAIHAFYRRAILAASPQAAPAPSDERVPSIAAHLWMPADIPEPVEIPQDFGYRNAYAFKDPAAGEHDPWYVVLPNMMALKLGYHVDDAVDKAHAEFIAAAINRAVAARASSANETGEEGAKPCKTCGGSRLVDDGEIAGSGGVEFENGPIKCVKDCPDCTAPAQAADPVAISKSIYQARQLSDEQDRWDDVHEGVYLACASQPQFYETRVVYAAPQPPAQAPFQQRVQPWMRACFGAEISADVLERNHRFFEEAGELVQACGMTREEAHALVDYTWSRPVGEPTQEVGGVMVTLAALCLANGLDMHAAGEMELARINVPATIEKIRAKQVAKPKHSPLPGPAQADSREGLTGDQRSTIDALIALTRAAFIALDDSEEREGPDGREHVIDSANFDAVSNALDRLEELPDDRPGYTLNAGGKAEWALRALLAHPGQPEPRAEVTGSERAMSDREAIIEECAKVCDEYAADQWNLYKGRAPYTGKESGRADADVQGRSDGADVCAERIRALKTAPTSDKGGA